MPAADSNQKFDQGNLDKILLLIEFLTDDEIMFLINRLQKSQIKRNQIRGENQDTIQT